MLSFLLCASLASMFLVSSARAEEQGFNVEGNSDDVVVKGITLTSESKAEENLDGVVLLEQNDNPVANTDNDNSNGGSGTIVVELEGTGEGSTTIQLNNDDVIIEKELIIAETCYIKVIRDHYGKPMEVKTCRKERKYVDVVVSTDAVPFVFN